MTALDEQIAVRLFGWWREDTHLHDGTPWSYWHKPTSGGNYLRPPYYSTGILDAFRVVDAMWERGWRLHLQQLYEEECIAWYAEFTPKRVCDDMVGRSRDGWNGDTAPEAIIMAALAVLDGEDA